MPKFVVKEGVHVDERGREYTKGQIVEHEGDLTKVFRGKFDYHNPALPVAPLPYAPPPAPPVAVQTAPTQTATQTSAAPAPTEAEEEDEETPTASLGTDQTAKFPHADENDFKVYKRNGKFFVYDADDMTKPLNPEGSAKPTVDSIVDVALGKSK